MIMEDKHRNAIQKNFASLVNQTDFETMVYALYEKEVFSAHMIETYIESREDSKTRKRMMYADLTRRGPKAYNKLLDALSENGYWDLVRALDPDSSLHARRRQNSPSDESSFVSIRTERQKSELIQGSSKIDNNPPPAVASTSKSTEISDLTEDPPFHVVKAVKFIEKARDAKVYKMRGTSRGCCVMFVYSKFMNNVDEDRKGAEEDVKNLKFLFKELGLKVLTYLNLTKEETESTLKNMKNIITPDMGCLFIVVSSRGCSRLYSEGTDVRCSDGGLIDVQEIISYYNNEKLPRLRGVPKVFIMQVCRGRNQYMGLPPLSDVDSAAFDDDDDLNRAGPSRLAPHRSIVVRPSFRQNSDILVAHSTLPGYVSNRDPIKGSWYIQCLCKVFAARAHEEDVLELLRSVDREMESIYKTQTSSVDNWGFNKRLYLHPGLTEDMCIASSSREYP